MVRFRALAALTTLAVAALLPAAPASAAPVRGPNIAGGDTLGGLGRCIATINLDGRKILAGYCGSVGTQISAGGVVIGTVSAAAFNGTWSIISITNPAVVQLAGIRTGAAVAPVSTAARATIGRSVVKSSPISGVRSGTVTGINQTVNYAQGSISGLDRTSICPSSGEAGAPIFAGTSVLAITWGGSGNCTSGGITYGVPVVPILQAYGLSVY
jgi:hypothetical protein